MYVDELIWVECDRVICAFAKLNCLIYLFISTGRTGLKEFQEHCFASPKPWHSPQGADIVIHSIPQRESDSGMKLALIWP